VEASSPAAKRRTLQPLVILVDGPEIRRGPCVRVFVIIGQLGQRQTDHRFVAIVTFIFVIARQTDFDPGLVGADIG
jgi:hypothetical protein